jgi:hypothetical protein
MANYLFYFLNWFSFLWGSAFFVSPRRALFSPLGAGCFCASRFPCSLLWRVGCFCVVPRRAPMLGRGGKRTGEMNGIIVATLAQESLPDAQVRAMFNVGQQRLQGIRASNPNLPQVACASLRGIEIPPSLGRYSKEQYKTALQYIREMPVEPGYACSHRLQRQYLRGGVSCRRSNPPPPFGQTGAEIQSF